MECMTDFKCATKEDRKKLYQYLIEKIDAGEIFNCCPVIAYLVFNNQYYFAYVISIETVCPELYMQKPIDKHVSDAWFLSMEERRLALLKAIQLCEVI